MSNHENDHDPRIHALDMLNRMIESGPTTGEIEDWSLEGLVTERDRLLEEMLQEIINERSPGCRLVFGQMLDLVREKFKKERNQKLRNTYEEMILDSELIEEVLKYKVPETEDDPEPC